MRGFPVVLGAFSALVLRAVLPAIASEANVLPYPFELSGEIDEVTSKGFVVDGVRVMVPKNDRVPWNRDEYVSQVDEDAIEEGALVQVVGSLEADGAVVAAYVVEAEGPLGSPLTYVAGIVDAVGEESLTIDGVEHAVARDAAGPILNVNQDHQIAFAELRVGDVVACYEFEHDETGVVQVDGFTVRPGGETSKLSGTVTVAASRGDEGTESGTILGHDGVYFEVEGVRCFVTYSGDDAALPYAPRYEDDDRFEAVWNAAEGTDVDMRGIYRDGVFFVYEASAPRRSAAKAAGRFRIDGVVTTVDGPALDVNGVSIVGSAKRSSRILRFSPGDRVVATGRVSTKRGITGAVVRRRRR